MLTNEYVKDYVKHVTQEHSVNDESPDFLETVSSIAPMTRARIKQVMEKQGEVHILVIV